jgi:Fe-S-cluster-containing dehydrogenase component
MTTEVCPFCGIHPFEYVDVGIGMVPVAVNCCHLGPLLFDNYADSETRKAAEAVAEELGTMPHGEARLAKAEEMIGASLKRATGLKSGTES